MANYYTTQNMGLSIPVVNVDPGPDWANNINASLTIVDGHTHLPGSGVQITSNAININADLPVNSFNLTSARSLRFTAQSGALSGGSDLGCLYEAGVDLYYNDGNGNQIRITQSGSVAGSAGTITGLPSGTASASYQSGSGTFQFQQGTSTAANIDAATLIVRYPGSYPTPSGNYIALQAPSSLSSGYALTLPALPGAGNYTLGINSSGTLAPVSYDSIGTGMTSNGADAIAASRTRTTGSTVGAGGVAVSATLSSFSTSSTASGTVVDTGLTVTITTSGRPVRLMVIGFGGITTPGFIQLSSPGSFAKGTLAVTNTTTTFFTSMVVLQTQTPSGNSVLESYPPSVISAVDTNVAGIPGTYTYKVQVNADSGSSTTLSMGRCQLIAYEL